MKGKLYKAFINAGFGKEANSLSTMIKCNSSNRKIRKKFVGVKKVGPAVGHYVAILDNIGEKKPPYTKDVTRVRNQAISEIHEFLDTNKTKIPQTFEGKIFSSRAYHRDEKYEEIKKFIKLFGDKIN